MKSEKTFCDTLYINTCPLYKKSNKKLELVNNTNKFIQIGNSFPLINWIIPQP